METLIRNFSFIDKTPTEILYDEFLITNGLGGYSSTSLNGSLTRKYHGLLISSLHQPLGRCILLNYINDKLKIIGHQHSLSAQEFANKEIPVIESLKKFRLENGIPIWTYQFDGYILEKTIFMTYHQNTVHIGYTLIEGAENAELSIQPFFDFRHHEASVLNSYKEQCEINFLDGQYEILPSNYPSLKIVISDQSSFKNEKEILEEVHYRIEAERGYDSIGKLTALGKFIINLTPKQTIWFTASSESWEVVKAMSAEEIYKGEINRRKLLLDRAQELHPNLMQSSFASELVLAADQFIIAPFSRTPDVIRSQALGNEPRTVIAGYHWFTDWGRDTMISLEGLTLIPGRIKEAEYILKTFALHIKEGLIPNMFPDKGNEGVYYTVDATLWFFHAIDRYYAYSKDDIFIKNLLPKLKEIINYHLSGTLYGIHVDPEDSLLTQGQKGYALTWMDAKVGDLVVTPREGKAVEINALWYNALCLLIEWIDTFEPSQNSQEYVVIAKQCYDSFNKKFWNEEGNCLYDLIEGKKTFDSSCRPNQLFSISLKYPILLKDKWEKVMEVIKNDLLTPYGMRTLSPKDPNYKIAYSGNLFLRDSAYHQGTIWPWLIGPYIDAFVKVYPDHTKDLKKILESFDMNMREGGIGTINEIFDGNEPYTHRGCIAQAWSVSEVLRSYLIILGKIDPI